MIRVIRSISLLAGLLGTLMSVSAIGQERDTAELDSATLSQRGARISTGEATVRSAPNAGIRAVLQNTAPTPAPTREALIADTRALMQELEADAAEFAGPAEAFGNSLSVAEREGIQSACTSLARNPNDAQATSAWREFVSQHADQSPQVMARLCLDPSYARLRGEIADSMQSLEDALEADLRALEEAQRRHREMMDMLSTFARNAHDMAMSIIRNMR